MARTNRFGDLLAQRLSRREVVAGGGRLIAAASLWQGGCSVRSTPAVPGFERIAPSKQDAIVVPAGYAAQVVLRWGDALHAGERSLDADEIAQGCLLEPGAATAQARQFGYNCDGLATYAIDAERLLVCVNHEFPSPDLMFPGWSEARRARSRAEFVQQHPECVPSMQAAVGLSVAELARDGGWRLVPTSAYNRRITANTRFEFSGPARGHALLSRPGSTPGVLGTLGNCAAGPTPWRTYLSGEENVNDYFGNAQAARFDADLARAYDGFGPRAGDSAYRWEHVDPRFDAARAPGECLKFGWVVELDPFDASAPIKKRTALGRFKHEGATTTLARDGRAAVYMGDDEAGQHLYKFVSARPFETARPDANRDLLDAGTLHVARFAPDGRGEWLPLVWGEQAELGPRNGFASQADVVIRCREAARLLGATALDRPEDVAVHPLDGRVYLSCTQNVGRDIVRDAASTAVNPRTPNPHGHILELSEGGSDAAAMTFRWEVLVLAGDPLAGGLHAAPLTGERLDASVTYFAGRADATALSAFANPDNLGFDTFGTLWIVTDGLQPGEFNNGCFVCPTAGEQRGAVRQFMSGPVGAEICGCEITADGETLFLSVQHPGAGGSIDAPVSHWPDGGSRAARPSLIAIGSISRGRPVGS